MFRRQADLSGKPRVQDFGSTTTSTGERAKTRHWKAFHKLLCARLAALFILSLGLIPLSFSSGAVAATSNPTLSQGQTLSADQSLISPSGQYRATMQGDGNLVVYHWESPVWRATWSSNTKGSHPRLVMQGDSNLVIYADQGALFGTGKVRVGSNRLVMQDDGNLVLYGSADIWSSKSTSERAIQWFYNNLGRTDYEGRCESAVENAFGRTGQYLTAAARPNATRDVKGHANWNNRVQKSPYTDAPRGALVFYNTSAAGHVAISLGNGQVVMSSAPGRRLGVASIDYYGSLAYGWAYAPW